MLLSFAGSPMAWARAPYDATVKRSALNTRVTTVPRMGRAIAARLRGTRPPMASSLDDLVFGLRNAALATATCQALYFEHVIVIAKITVADSCSILTVNA